MDIILASTSPYRRRLLERLHIDFRCIPPETDETPVPGEAPQAMAERLALSKAKAVALVHQDSVVIGSDQVAALGERILSKPGNFENAAAQLRASSGREITFFTAVAVISLGQSVQKFHVEPTTVRLRTLDDEQISYYLHRDQPYDCAGSFKVECLGISLIEHINGCDPTALEGLPLIRLSELLIEAGVNILGHAPMRKMDEM